MRSRHEKILLQRVKRGVSRKLEPGIVALDNKMVPLSSPLGRSYNFCDGPLRPLQPPRFSSPISLLPFASYVCVRVYISKGFGQEALLRPRKERGTDERKRNGTGPTTTKSPAVTCPRIRMCVASTTIPVRVSILSDPSFSRPFRKK